MSHGNETFLSQNARLIVGIPSLGRAGILSETVRHFTKQTRRPDLVIISVCDDRDVEPNLPNDLPFPIQIVRTSRGATNQRNRILKELQRDDTLLFLDDDFLLAKDYLYRLEEIFKQNQDIAMVTGDVLADGIGGKGFDHNLGLRLLNDRDCGQRNEEYRSVYNCYGCNMAMAARFVLDNHLRFDEDLPLYSWLEDLDFSRRVAPFGRIVQAQELKGVHLGAKSGRTTGVLLGYSQIANPLYLVEKGTMARWRALRLMGRNLASNLAKSFKPESWIDRRGRLQGNLLAFRDMTLGRMSPLRILAIKRLGTESR